MQYYSCGLYIVNLFFCFMLQFCHIENVIKNTITKQTWMCYMRIENTFKIPLSSTCHVWLCYIEKQKEIVKLTIEKEVITMFIEHIVYGYVLYPLLNYRKTRCN